MASDSTSDVALDCELEVLPLEGSKHDVYQYFCLPVIEGNLQNQIILHVGCEYKKKIKHSGNTSNMRFHLLLCQNYRLLVVK